MSTADRSPLAASMIAIIRAEALEIMKIDDPELRQARHAEFAENQRRSALSSGLSEQRASDLAAQMDQFVREMVLLLETAGFLDRNRAE